MKTNYSAQRNLILDTLKGCKDHPSAEMLLEKCKKTNPKIGIATIYRNLDVLEKQGKIIRVSGSVGKERYDGDISMHQHIICPICGNIEDVICSDNVINVLKGEIEEKQYESAQLSFFRICENCKKIKDITEV